MKQEHDSRSCDTYRSCGTYQCRGGIPLLLESLALLALFGAVILAALLPLL